MDKNGKLDELPSFLSANHNACCTTRGLQETAAAASRVPRLQAFAKGSSVHTRCPRFSQLGSSYKQAIKYEGCPSLYCALVLPSSFLLRLGG